MRKLTALLLCQLCFVHFLLAQSRTITGQVNDGNGQPVPGASIIVKGTQIGTISMNDGRFSLTVPGTARSLIISATGMVSQEVSIAKNSVVSVMMQFGSSDLDEVVVVAYGTAKKGSFTGTTAQISAKEIENRPIVNVSNALTGKAAGVQTTGGSGQPGSGPAIRIRGFGSINASSDPLYVVDGVPYDGSLANLNTNDIETIAVLKDAASAALYGSRAANGVVMIVTKHGKRNSNRVQFTATQGISSRGIPEYDRVSAQEYYPLMWESYRNSLAYSSTIPLADASKIASGLFPRITSGSNKGKQLYNGKAYADIFQQLGYNPFNVGNTDIVLEDGTLNPAAQLKYADDLDWNKELMRTGSRQDYNMSLTGGGQKSDYLMSIGYTNEKGFVINSDYRRITGRINANSQPMNWFRTGLNVSGTVTRSNQANDGGSTSYVNPFFATRVIGPIYPVYAHDPSTGEFLLDGLGQPYYDLGAGRPIYNGRHPVAETKWNVNDFKRNVLSARAYAEIIFTKDLKFTTNISTDITNYLGSSYENKIVGDGAPGGRGRKQATTTTSYTFNQLLNYTKDFGDHHIEVLAGHENYDYTYNYLYGFRTGQIVDGVTELVNFTTTSSLNSYTDRATIESYLSRINYGFADKYFISASYRTDGNSRFSEKVRWGNFGSVGLGWRLDRESFMQSVSWVNQLKLRSSYGSVGNDNGIGLYPYRALYDLANNAAEPGFLQSSLDAPNLTWEKNIQLDVGVDFGLFDNRLSGSFEYFNRQSDNLLFQVRLPLSTGLETVWKNVGSMYNKGFELQLSVDAIRQKDFNWNINFNWTTFKNQVTKLPEGQEELISGTKKLMVGHSIYDYWLREWYGVDPEDGAGLYRAATYDPSESRVPRKGDTLTTLVNNGQYHYAGSAIPDFYGGITNSFRYKAIELSILINYQVGGKIYDQTYATLMHNGTYGNALSVDALNRWQSPGQKTNVPRMDNAKVGQWDAQSDRWLTSASFLNIRAVNLMYNLPAKFIAKANAQSARVYLSAENLWLFSARKGMNVSQAFTGVTSNAYTPARILTAGINVTF